MSEIHCSNCDRKIKSDEEIIVHEDEVYCRDCVGENTYTSYWVDGECIGDETDIEDYDTIEEFKKSLEEEIKHWETQLKENEKTGNERYMNFYKEKLGDAKSKYDKYFGEDGI